MDYNHTKVVVEWTAEEGVEENFSPSESLNISKSLFLSQSGKPRNMRIIGFGRTTDQLTKTELENQRKKKY